MPTPPMVRCREIRQPDTDGIIDLLTSGFRYYRERDYWQRALRRLGDHTTPPGLPRFGYLLEHDDVAVGVLLLIFSSVVIDGAVRVRCNVCSWYVEPGFKSYATMLASYATRHRHVTYFNITPGPPTWPILDALGYERFASGLFVAVPALCQPWLSCSIRAVTSRTHPCAGLGPMEAELLLTHVDYGCISLICETGTQTHPFVFGLQRKYGLISMAHLIYCQDIQDFVRFAGPLGRFLARRGVALVVLDSNGPIPGLIGRYMDGRPKYFKGPNRPRLGDVAYSERVMFGY